MSNALVELTNKLSTTLGMGANGVELYNTLKATAFKGQVTDAQMTALLVVANQYSLNPWTKEIYAFPDKNNGIVPIVGVDGWARIINSHPQFDGMEFEQDDESCTCIIYRKDRSRPIRITEYMAECKRGAGPWQSHPKRMLRHKAMIQCTRIAFGFTGIYDEDEAVRINEAQQQERVVQAVVLPPFDQAVFESKLPAYKERIEAGKPAQEVVSFLQAKYTLTEEQVQSILALEPSAIDSPSLNDEPF